MLSCCVWIHMAIAENASSVVRPGRKNAVPFDFRMRSRMKINTLHQVLIARHASVKRSIFLPMPCLELVLIPILKKLNP